LASAVSDGDGSPAALSDATPSSSNDPTSLGNRSGDASAVTQLNNRTVTGASFFRHMRHSPAWYLRERHRDFAGQDRQ
jgi:hypothetical protein